MDAATVAEAHQNRVIAVSDLATTRSLRLWRQMQFQNLDGSWAAIEAALVSHAVKAQLTAAKTSDSYVSSVASASDAPVDGSRIVPEAFAGVDGSGRDLTGMLFGAVTTTKTAIGGGFGAVRSMEAGAAYLAAMMKTVVHDAGRSSDMVAATGKGFTHYVRVVNSGACSRCAILAGISSYQTAFKRHPACKCTSAPVEDGKTNVPDGFHDNPDSYFESLSSAEQDRVFTKAGADAIRNGAGIPETVGARRGATGITTSRGKGRKTVPNSGRRLQKTRIGTDANGKPVEVYTTSEGTTKRGDFYRRQQILGSPGRIRLMPESIMGVANGPEEAKALLRDAGYMGIPNLSPVDALAQARADRAIADAAYARAGYQLG